MSAMATDLALEWPLAEIAPPHWGHWRDSMPQTETHLGQKETGCLTAPVQAGQSTASTSVEKRLPQRMHGN
jgi:hypothetical protein